MKISRTQTFAAQKAAPMNVGGSKLETTKPTPSPRPTQDSIELSPMYLAAGAGAILGASSGIGASLGGLKGMAIGAAVSGAVVGGSLGFLDGELTGKGGLSAIVGTAATVGAVSAALGGVGLMTNSPLLTSVAAGVVGLGGVGLAISLLA